LPVWKGDSSRKPLLISSFQQSGMAISLQVDC
jgi:hypothetical protein